MDLEKMIKTYFSLELDTVIDHQKFSEYSLTYHSSSIDGSSLTEIDTEILLDEGLTPKGKLLQHSLMVKDYYEALQYIIAKAKEKQPVSIELIQAIASLVLKTTDRHNTSNYDKVEPLTKQLVEHLQKKMASPKSIMEATELAFAAHFNLVTIHPFYNGNGRTSRLLMNYIQAYYKLPLATVYKEDRAEYFQALTDAREKEDNTIFQNFMKTQYKKLLTNEINAYRQMQQNKQLKPRLKKGRGRSLFF